jgi:DNA-binding transcriptional LysR family regulator
MNIHHLELFYYVGRFGGITEAVRRMPYGIQQPAVSSQLIQLEKVLGVTLFRRRPFALTPAGKELYAFVEPFFGNIDAMALKLQGGTVHHISIGASEVVLRDHLPFIAKEVKAKFPDLRFTLREGYQPQIEQWLRDEEIDFAFTLLGEKKVEDFHSLAILKIPLMLIVPHRSRIQTADELWARDRIDEALVTLPSYEAMCRSFQVGLSRRQIDWFPSIEVSSLKLIETYVAEGYGIGLFLDIPTTKLHSRVRSLPLPGFPPVLFGAMWRGTPTPVIEAFVEATKNRARKILGRACMTP